MFEMDIEKCYIICALSIKGENKMVAWFNKQEKIVKFLLLIIPFVGWVCEVVLRWSKVLEKATVMNIVLAVVYTFVGWAWFLTVIDAVLVLLDKNMLLYE